MGTFLAIRSKLVVICCLRNELCISMRIVNESSHKAKDGFDMNGLHRPIENRLANISRIVLLSSQFGSIRNDQLQSLCLFVCFFRQKKEEEEEQSFART